MKNILFSVLFTLGFLSLTALAQTNPVQITGGKIIYQADNLSNYENSEFISERFVSQGRIFNPTPSRWSGICDSFDCRGGRTFNDWSGYGLYLENSYSNANLTINGVTYQRFYNYGEINISRNTFQIPRFVKKKGRLFFSAPFTMSGRMRICQVSEANSSCPPDKLLLNENIAGHGTLRVTMKIKNAYTDRLVTFLTPESFEYKFEQ